MMSFKPISTELINDPFFVSLIIDQFNHEIISGISFKSLRWGWWNICFRLGPFPKNPSQITKAKRTPDYIILKFPFLSTNNIPAAYLSVFYELSNQTIKLSKHLFSAEIMNIDDASQSST